MNRSLVIFLLLTSSGLFQACQKETTPPMAGEPVNLGQPMKLTPSDPRVLVTPAPK